MAHGPPPGRLLGKRQHLGKIKSRRNGEPVDQVALTFANHLVVNGQHQGIKATVLRTGGEFAGETSVFVDKYLHPFHAMV